MAINPHFKDVKDQIARGGAPEATVRELLRWFAAERRGRWVVYMIRNALKTAGLATVPDFEFEYIDSTVRFIEAPAASVPAAQPEAPQSTVTSPSGDSPSVAPLPKQDPAYRVKKLEAANRTPITITPDKPVVEATTLMLIHNYSQLPVMQGERKVLGMIRWKSLGSRLAMGAKCERVSDAVDSVTVVTGDASIFQVADIIARHEVVLVQASSTDPRITGILTSADLAVQFGELGEPFLLLGEIENQVRETIGSKMSQAELASVKDPNDTARSISDVSDLTFG